MSTRRRGSAASSTTSSSTTATDTPSSSRKRVRPFKNDAQKATVVHVVDETVTQQEANSPTAAESISDDVEPMIVDKFPNVVTTVRVSHNEEKADSYEDVDEDSNEVSDDTTKTNLDSPPEPKYDCTLVKTWNVFHPDGSQFIPPVCPSKVESSASKEETEHSCSGSCVIIKWGRRRYLRFYYSTGPIRTSVQRFRCTSCDTVFSVLDPKVIPQYPVGAYCTMPLLRYGYTFIDLEFFERLYELHRETYNANLVIDTAHRDWKIHYIFQKRQYLQSIQSYKQCKKCDKTIFAKFPEVPRAFATFNRQFWIRLVLDINIDLAAEVQKKLDVLAKWQSRRLSIDHTFRVVKNVVAYVGDSRNSNETTTSSDASVDEPDTRRETTEITIEDETKEDREDDEQDDDGQENDEKDDEYGKQRKRTVHLAYAELFVINENGMVVGFQHCKDKTFESAKPALERIWAVQDSAVQTKVVWTDDVRAEERQLQSCYKTFRPQNTLIVGQDSFHVCEQRILRETSKKHQDFTIFKTIIKAGFRKFHQGEGWLNEDEYKSWLLKCADDFSFPTSSALTDEELVETVASLEAICRCHICEDVRAFIDSSQKLALLMSCSRKQRHHVYHCTAGQADTIHTENHGQGLMLKKMPEHPHSRSLDNYFTVLGQQVVEQSSLGSHFVPMSDEGYGDGIVSRRGKDVMKNQTDDIVVRGLWAHYSTMEMGLLGTTVNERFHKFANSKLKGIRIMGWDLFCLYILWLIQDWNELHSSASWVTPLPDDVTNPFPDAMQNKLHQLDSDFELICKGRTPYHCVRFVPTTEKSIYTPEGLVEAGIPVNLDKFRWNAKATGELMALVKDLNLNKTNKPPTKSMTKFIKENICGGCGPSEDQIKRKLMTITYFSH